MLGVDRGVLRDQDPGVRSFGPPESAVGRTKQRRLRLLAAEWLAAHDRHGAVRFDVAAITGVQIEVFEAAF